MNAMELVEAIEGSGGRILVNGQTVSIKPGSAAIPLRDELIKHKAEILELLSRRSDLPPGVRMRRYEPKAPPIALSDASVVTNTEKFIRATLTQVGHHLQGRSWLDGNWPLPVLLQRLEAVGVEVEIDDARTDAARPVRFERGHAGTNQRRVS